jgi:hypothetical protein
LSRRVTNMQDVNGVAAQSIENSERMTHDGGDANL